MDRVMTTPSPAVSSAAAPDDLAPLRRALFAKLADAGALLGEADRARVLEQIASEFKALGAALADDAKVRLFQQVADEVCGFGPIQQLLDDPTVTEIMVNRADRVYAERKGRSERTDIIFDDDAHVRCTIEKIIAPLGRRLDDDYPLVDARLPDGSRVNASAKPCAIDGCNLTIRKFPATRLTMADLVTFGAITQPIAQFLQACVVSRMNIVVAGGTGSGKTTLLNVLSGYIPEHE